MDNMKQEFENDYVRSYAAEKPCKIKANNISSSQNSSKSMINTPDSQPENTKSNLVNSRLSTSCTTKEKEETSKESEVFELDVINPNNEMIADALSEQDPPIVEGFKISLDEDNKEKDQIKSKNLQQFKSQKKVRGKKSNNLVSDKRSDQKLGKSKSSKEQFIGSDGIVVNYKPYNILRHVSTKLRREILDAIRFISQERLTYNKRLTFNKGNDPIQTEFINFVEKHKDRLAQITENGIPRKQEAFINFLFGIVLNKTLNPSMTLIGFCELQIVIRKFPFPVDKLLQEPVNPSTKINKKRPDRLGLITQEVINYELERQFEKYINS